MKKARDEYYDKVTIKTCSKFLIDLTWKKKEEKVLPHNETFIKIFTTIKKLEYELIHCPKDKKEHGMAMAEKLAESAKKNVEESKPTTVITKNLSLSNSENKNKQIEPVVFIKGLCSNNGQPNASAGYGVWWGPDSPLNSSSKPEGKQSNQQDEIEAALVVMKQAREQFYEKVTIKTSSDYIVKGFNQWIDKWIESGWVKYDGSDLEHKKVWIKIWKTIKQIEVKSVSICRDEDKEKRRDECFRLM